MRSRRIVIPNYAKIITGTLKCVIDLLPYILSGPNSTGLLRPKILLFPQS